MVVVLAALLILHASRSMNSLHDCEILWAAQWPVLEDYQERTTTVNIVCYSEILWD
jgi:hypothetical protein